jgi:hypothetical protein
VVLLLFRGVCHVLKDHVMSSNLLFQARFPVSEGKPDDPFRLSGLAVSFWSEPCVANQFNRLEYSCLE